MGRKPGQTLQSHNWAGSYKPSHELSVSALAPCHWQSCELGKESLWHPLWFGQGLEHRTAPCVQQQWSTNCRVVAVDYFRVGLVFLSITIFLLYRLSAMPFFVAVYPVFEDSSLSLSVYCLRLQKILICVYLICKIRAWSLWWSTIKTPQFLTFSWSLPQGSYKHTLLVGNCSSLQWSFFIVGIYSSCSISCCLQLSEPKM